VRRLRLPRRRIALAVAAVLVLAGTLVLLAGLTAGRGAAALHPVAAAPSATPGPRAEARGTASPSPSPVARYTPSSDVRLVIPSVGMDLPLLPMTPSGGTIDPPLLTAGYWIAPYGAPVGDAGEATNTLYVAAHSAGSGDDGFDPLIAGPGADGTLTAGDVVEVRTPTGTVRYTVRSTHRYGKDALPGADEVWEVVPGRLVLVTCFQRADGREATENLVVVAEAE
jgi:sortase (surface protein transpeptidase)